VNKIEYKAKVRALKMFNRCYEKNDSDTLNFVKDYYWRRMQSSRLSVGQKRYAKAYVEQLNKHYL
jgi:hypothetical protein